MSTIRRILPTSLLAGLLAVFLLQVRPFSPAKPFRLQVKIHSDTAGRARLMWSAMHGSVTPDRDSVPVSKGDQVLTFNLPFTTIYTSRFRPQDALNAIRLDPLDRDGEVVIGEMKVIGPKNEIVRTFPASTFSATKKGTVLKVEDGSVVFASHPEEGVLILPSPGLQLARRTLPFEPRSAAVQFGGMTLAVLLALWLASRIPAGTRSRLGAALAKLRDDQAAWPVATLFLAAAFATAASCYPVIFCGKTFVSPNFGPLPMLYEDFPTLPQSPHEIPESSRGSDTGATLWAHLPYSVIQHRAIFGHGELPLWNRYAYCGVPLLGQGQSMLGDPLHWIAIAGGGAVWAWDVKYCIAKLLFSFGVGLLVFAATGRIWLAALLAISSSFLGYFPYRFSHCAFFSLCYSPWILLCWLRAARTTGRVWPWALALAAANFWELNSGTAKEAAILIAGLNFNGGVLVLLAEGNWRSRLRRIALMGFGNVLFLMLSAPHWMLFLDALRQATTFNPAVAFQIQPSLALGFFDDLFYSQATRADEFIFNPSTNFLVLLGCLWAAVDLRRLLRDRTFLAILLCAALTSAIVFGVVSPAFLARVPFIANILHVDSTFSCVLIIQLLILAAFGLRSLWDRAARKRTTGDAMVVAIIFALLVALFLGYTQAAHREGRSLLHYGETMRTSGFFRAYALALGAALLAMPWVVRGLRRQPSAGHVLLGGLCLFLFHFRHGLWTGTKFDSYVANPCLRADLAAPSPSVRMIQASQNQSGEPSRAFGLAGVLVPGCNTILGLEHFNGPDALVNPWQRQLEEKSGIPILWAWRCLLLRENFPPAQVFGDLWNVRWYLGMPAGVPREMKGLTLETTLDLQLYTSPSAWPRAFFTNQLAECSSLDDFVALLRAADGRPFAALVPEKSTAAQPAELESLDGRTIVAASEYHLTENSTAFTISAPTSGVAVLGNSFESGNWRVTLDGLRVGCFRVNHAFLGVAIPEAGVHKLRFVYWPRLLTPALWISAGGLLLALGTIFLGMKKRPSRQNEETAPVSEISADTTMPA